MRLFAIAAALLVAPFHAGTAAELPISIVAAENFYGEVAAAIGGDRVKVENILISPDADPHDFEPPPSVARAVADAAVVVFNGADYDHWMENLLESTERPERSVIEAAGLIGVKEGDNPHVWYDPRVMPAVAEAMTKTLASLDPEGAEGYEARRQVYLATLAPLDTKVGSIKQRFDGTPITATEPVFGYMADALGLTVSNQDFQTAIMNETEPSAKDIAAVVDDIQSRKVKALIYNTQVTDAMTEQLLGAAREANVPVVGVTETVPDGMSYADWMIGQLESLEKALAGPSS
jgi:zinc/manganese transport system substrate-binding protein